MRNRLSRKLLDFTLFNHSIKHKDLTKTFSKCSSIVYIDGASLLEMKVLPTSVDSVVLIL